LGGGEAKRGKIGLGLGGVVPDGRGKAGPNQAKKCHALQLRDATGQKNIWVRGEEGDEKLTSGGGQPKPESRTDMPVNAKKKRKRYMKRTKDGGYPVEGGVKGSENTLQWGEKL